MRDPGQPRSSAHSLVLRHGTAQLLNLAQAWSPLSDSSQLQSTACSPTCVHVVYVWCTPHPCTEHNLSPYPTAGYSWRPLRTGGSGQRPCPIVEHSQTPTWSWSPVCGPAQPQAELQPHLITTHSPSPHQTQSPRLRDHWNTEGSQRLPACGRAQLETRQAKSAWGAHPPAALSQGSSKHTPLLWPPLMGGVCRAPCDSQRIKKSN